MTGIHHNPNIYLLQPDSIHASKLTKEQRVFLQALNNQLAAIEPNLKAEFNTQTSLADNRIADPKDWVKDYETNCDITFYAKAGDSAYSEDNDDDNILVTLSLSSTHHLADDTGNNENHNEYQYRDHPLKNEYHCWLYHCLYDHTELGWSNILRIGIIWVDFKLEFQGKFTNFDT